MTKLKNAFTLIELMVVVSIAAILFSIATVTYSNVTKSSRDARKKADLEAIRQALELYRSTCGAYPSAPLDTSIACGTQTYMSSLPKDPKTGDNYVYATTTSGYDLTATLENNCSGATCTYTVKNP